MRILHVAETAHGGLGTYLREILPLQLAEFGPANVHVVVPREHLQQVGPVPQGGLTTFARKARGLRSTANFIFAVAGAIRRFQPDVVHVHSSVAGAVVRPMLALRKSAPKIVYCPHGWSFDAEFSAVTRAVLSLTERMLSPLNDVTIAISRHEQFAGTAIGISAARLRLVENGISPDLPDHPPVEWADSRLKVLFVGRLDPQKGFDLLAEVAGELEDEICIRAAGVNVVAGSAAVPSSSRNIEYLGWLGPAEVTAQMACADVVVVPSRWEGFGLVAIEAMRAGKPVVASDAGGLPHIVEDGVTGRLFRAGDLRGLKAALLADDLKALRQMGQAGRQRFLQRYQINRLHDGLCEVYASVTRQAKDQTSAPSRPRERNQPAPEGVLEIDGQRQ